MNDEHRPTDFESLQPPLEAAVRAALAEAVPEDAVGRVKARARQLAAAPAALARAGGSPHRSWKNYRSVAGGLAAAAAVLAAWIGSASLRDDSGQAFAQVVEKVKGASSVRLTMTTRFGRQPAISGRMYLEGNRLRIEQFDGMLIHVADLDRKQALFLDVHRRLAQPAEIDANVAREFANPIDQLRRAKSNDAEPLGEEVLQGRRTQVYRLREVDLLGMKADAEMLVWVDAESELPAKIVIRDSDPKAETEIRFDELVWNERLDARLFSLSIPDGFQPGIVVGAPRRSEPAQPDAVAPDAAAMLAEGVLARDRVPAGIVWGRQGATITALMRDPESVPPLDRRPNELRQWDVATGQLRWSETVAGAGWVAGTADGKTLATVIGFEIQLRDAASGKIRRKWATDQPLSPLAFSPDGKVLAAGITEWGRFGGSGGRESGGVEFWDVERASLVRSISDDQPVTFIRYSVGGTHLASSSNEGPVKLWAQATGELARIFPGRLRADFSPDGETIACPSASSSGDKSVAQVDIYQLRDGSLVKSFASEKGASASHLLWVTFSPDGRLLAAADWNGSVTLWDAATGERKRTIADHQAGVLTAVFAPDGATLATGSEDKTLRLWKVPAEWLQPAR
ncbi:MAG: hypothetical protein WD847_18720 [Pirellulales bacterium]